ncbi:hypothetical protein F4804DRAFT_351298 [Jackrogersella minutella]|nr:hypothetical protein F4804DRAFT_351298 [Jackrogersella minutella]
MPADVFIQPDAIPHDGGRIQVRGDVPQDENVRPELFEAAKPFLFNGDMRHDEPFQNIVFDKDKLNEVLTILWERLQSTQHRLLPNWLQRAPGEEITRSIPLETTEVELNGRVLPSISIDLFLKVRTNVRGQDTIVGTDKNGPLGTRRYQTSTSIPTEGLWHANRQLSAVDRTAILSLKWWKNDIGDNRENHFDIKHPEKLRRPKQPLTFSYEKIQIKSHHFLIALNALHELDTKDNLYVPLNVSQPFTMKRLLDASFQPMNTLYVQASADWDKFQCVIESEVIPTFNKEILSVLRGDRFLGGEATRKLIRDW